MSELENCALEGSRMKIYVIGPVTGLEADNRHAFTEARRRLAEMGMFNEVRIPHDFIPSGTPWEEAMRISIRALLDSDAVAVLEGAADSRGASLEREIALALKMPCRPVADWLEAGADSRQRANVER